MRSYIAAAGALAIAATAANAADCNPTYNVTSAGSCINDCNLVSISLIGHYFLQY
jgi:hypothetical protein